MSAVAQVAGLLKSSQPLNLDGDYLDVLGERDAMGPHLGQQVFRSKVLPKIYERFWRPAVSFVFLGPSGVGSTPWGNRTTLFTKPYPLKRFWSCTPCT